MKLNNAIIGKRIKTIRKQRNISQIQLSDIIDKRPTDIRRLFAHRSSCDR